MTVLTAARALTPILLALVLALTACGGGGSGPSGPDDTERPSSTLECEDIGFPCRWADVSTEIIEATLARTDEALVRLDGGQTTADVAAWLDAQDDVAEVQSDDSALRLRLQGGRGMWIAGPDAPLGPGPDAGPSRRLRDPQSFASSANPVVVDPQHVAGDAPEKRALVLSPFFHQFGEWDDGPLVRDILQTTRGYEGRVEFSHNAAETDMVPLDRLRAWTEYEIVHVTTHGQRICSDGVCRGGIDVGLLDAYVPAGATSDAETVKSLEATGLEIRTSTVTGTRYVRASADFFREAYPSGLDDTLVFLNACQTQDAMGVDVDIVDALRRGGRAVVLGWSDAVTAVDATAAAEAFYDTLSEHGYPARVAWEKLGDLRTGTPATDGDGTAPVLGLEGPTDGNDLRIREVVTVLHPTTGAELTSADRVGAIGVAGDGEADAAPYRVRVEGVLEEHVGDSTVHVTVDGVAAAPIPLAEGTKNADDAWEVQGTVQLPYDLSEDREVAWTATTALHDGGESAHERTATLSGVEPLLGTTWALTAKHTVHWIGFSTPYYATATILLTFEPGQDPMDPQPDYAITGGTISWDYSHATPNCTASAPAITFDLEEANIFSPRRITFDATQTPFAVTGWLRTQTPWVTVSSVCDAYSGTREHRATHNWFEVGPGDPPQTVQDGELIRGTRCFVQHHTNGTTFTTRSDYVIRRLRPGDTSPPPTLHEGSCL